jgi:methionine-rich copper-binding protein CopC
MQDFQHPARGIARARRILAPALALAALALTSQAAFATADGGQPKPQLNVEAARTPQGAQLTFKGKNWAPSARIKITGSRAPGSNRTQDFGMYSADSAGTLSGRKLAACSTNNMEDGQNEAVTVTAMDSASGVKATAKVEGGAWVCQ